MKALLCFVIVSGSALVWAAEPKVDPKLKVSKEEQEVLDLVNEIRAKEKLPVLKPHAILFSVARAHAVNQGKQKKVEHMLDGKAPWDRVEDAGYDYATCNENVAWLPKWSAKELVDGWMNSKVHRDNILGKKFKETGIGIFEDKEKGKGGFYIAEVFASQR
jgi:uncharacterized protein YkwD